jgi:hypothetical protein
MALVLSSLLEEPLTGSEWMTVGALLLVCVLLLVAPPRRPRRRSP